MLKKAGIVVLGAAAGMLSLAPLASAGESHSHERVHHHERDVDGGTNRDVVLRDCGDSAAGLVNVSCVANDAQVEDIDILSNEDNDGDDDVQVTDGGSSEGLVNVANVLNNLQIKDVDVASSEN